MLSTSHGFGVREISPQDDNDSDKRTPDLVGLTPSGVVGICPSCQGTLIAQRWLIPGTRVLQEAHCSDCSAICYLDLPSGHSVKSSILLEQARPKLHGNMAEAAFPDWFSTYYERRVERPLGLERRRYRQISAPLVLNCLDWLYGHSLLKLFNAEHFLKSHADRDLIVVVPRQLAWLVPDGVAEAWILDWDWRNGLVWNDWLVTEFSKIDEYPQAATLAVALPHPHPLDFSVTRFTGVEPFNAPWSPPFAITLVWRSDRFWMGGIGERIGASVMTRRPLLRLGRWLQILAYRRLLRKLYEWQPEIDVAMVGLGQGRPIDKRVQDLRVVTVSEETERAWCERYARSNVVIGVHGSNMILPSAHAGSVLELIPNDRWGNIIQDLVIRQADSREALILNRILPASSSPKDVAIATISLLADRVGLFRHQSTSSRRSGDLHDPHP